MPCSKGMSECHARCLHRALVEEYRDARDARESLRESGAGLQMEPDEFDREFPAVHFKAWIEGQGGGAGRE